MKLFHTTLAAALLAAAPFAIHAQTTVSGGLFANTTWTLANSPYIVTDTLVVFPGVTLTIEPGVLVKFDGGVQLEVRQGAIRAIGTPADSITFTSNTSTAPGSWNQVLLHGGAMTDAFSYCTFRYATTGISDERDGTSDSLLISHSSFTYNITGLDGQGTGHGVIDNSVFRYNTGHGVLHNFGGVFHHCDFSYNQSTGLDCAGYNYLYDCTISHNQTGITGIRMSEIHNSTIDHNQTGISLGAQGVLVQNCSVDENASIGIDIGSRFEGVYDCHIGNNGTGISDHNPDGFWTNTIKRNIIESNAVGIQLSISNDSIYCNGICGNTAYDLRYIGANNVAVPNNHWCTADSASTQAVIYDAHDDASSGLVSYMPMDSACYLSAGGTTGIAIQNARAIAFSIYPNPTADRLILELPAGTSKAEIRILDLTGALQLATTATHQRTDLDVTSLAIGVYLIEVRTGNNISRQKFIKE